METGNVILVSNPFRWQAPISSLLYMVVRLFVGRWHHCCLYWETNEGHFIVEATGKGVIATEYCIWLKRWPNRETKVLPLTCPGWRFTRHLGKRYDRYSFLFACLVKLVCGRWLGLTGEKAYVKLYCYELAALAHFHPEPFSILPSEFLEVFDRQQPV